MVSSVRVTVYSLGGLEPGLPNHGSSSRSHYFSLSFNALLVPRRHAQLYEGLSGCGT